MLTMTRTIFNFIGAVVILKIAFAFWCAFVLFIFMFGGRPNEADYKAMSFTEQMQVNFLDNVRHNVRIVYGELVPLESEYFLNMTEEQKKTLPPASRAVFKMNKYQKIGMKDLGVKMTQLDYMIRDGQKRASREIASKFKQMKFSTEKN